MDIYLMQHGVATSAEEDPARPLTSAGRGDVEAVAARAAACGVRIGQIVHSGKLRAEQSAGVLADAVRGRLEAHVGLNPSDPVEPVADWLQKQARLSPDAAIAVVGHLPFLDRLASLLVAGDRGRHVIHFQNAALVKLVPNAEAPGYAVAWILPPELA